MANDKDPFYVGYLPLPPRMGTFVKVMMGVVLLGTISLAFFLAPPQQDPGPGQLDGSKAFAIEGHLSVDPYPIVYVKDAASPGRDRAVLLVSRFKFGALDRATPASGKRVRVEGQFISRDGRSVFQLEDGEGAITVLSDESIAPATEDLGAHTLRGEITDSKCFLGMMKPGFGKTHRACAVRCISGGVPPVFVTRDSDSKATIYVLTDAARAALHEALLPYVAEPVEIQGRLSRRGDLLFFSADPGRITRQ